MFIDMKSKSEFLSLPNCESDQFEFEVMPRRVEMYVIAGM